MGAGLTDPGSADGGIATGIAGHVQPIRLRIAGVEAEILYAGAAPGIVSGVTQIIARVPQGIAGGLQSIELVAGTRASRVDVLVAIARE